MKKYSRIEKNYDSLVDEWNLEFLKNNVHEG